MTLYQIKNINKIGAIEGLNMQISGARMVIEALAKENVEVVFGYPGGAIMNVYDEIYKQNYFEHILTRHEQGAIHAADGYARSSGKVGVSIVTSGPGFTNAITGLATAYMDSVPLVVISGQVPTTIIGTDGFQEIDAVGISRPTTKHNYLVQNIKDLPRILKEAFYIAKSGRPGPVHIDLPKDITAMVGEFDYDKDIDLTTYKPHTKGSKRQIDLSLKLIANAKRPLLYLGGGIVKSDSYKLIRQISDTYNIPAVETLMAKGVMGSDNPNLFGMVGMHGEYAANMAMYEADVIISLGARFDDRVVGRLDEFAKNAKIIHIDIDPASISKIVHAHYPIVGDLKVVLKDMLDIANKYNFNDYSGWILKLQDYKKQHPLKFIDSDSVIKPQWIIKRVGEILGNKANITTDVGQHQMWTAQFYPFDNPRQFATSGGLGTMGYGLPAAMGVARASSDRVSINFTGDGSILMNIQELQTCKEFNLPVINIILNNNYLGMVRQWQTMFYEDRISQTDLSNQPDFVKLIEAFGGNGYRVDTKDKFDKALEDAVKNKKVAIIEVIVDRREDVLPMVPNGHALNQMQLLEGE